jgi:transforming growth factor-beta-induced protein
MTSQKCDIVDTAAAAGSFKTLVCALTAAHPTEALKASGSTVFAPNDAAFLTAERITLPD